MKRLPVSLLLIAMLGLLGAAQPTQAQTPSWKHQLVFNTGPQFVTGDNADAFKTGLAIDAGYYHRASNAFFIGAFGGYHQFAGKGTTADLDVIPLNLAFKYNFSLTGIQPYVGGEAGLFLLDNGSSSSKFGIAPRLGVRIPLSRGIDLDLNLKYNVIFNDDSNFTYVGTNGGFAYILDRANIEYR